MDLHAKLAHCRQMQINRPQADLTAAGSGENRPPHTGQERPQKHYRGAHFPHQVLRNITPVHSCRIHCNTFALPYHGTTEICKDLNCGTHIRQIRAVVNYRAPIGQK